MLFRLDVLAAVADNHPIPVVRPEGLLGEHHLRLLVAVGDEFAVLLFLDVAVVVFHQQVFEQMVPFLADVVGDAFGIGVELSCLFSVFYVFNNSELFGMTARPLDKDGSFAASFQNQTQFTNYSHLKIKKQ